MYWDDSVVGTFSTCRADMRKFGHQGSARSATYTSIEETGPRALGTWSIAAWPKFNRRLSDGQEQAAF